MGQIKDYEETIDGIRYRTRTLTADQGLKLLPRLFSILPPGVAEIILTLSDEDRDKVQASKDSCLAIMQSVARQAATVPDGLGVISDLLAHTEFERVAEGDSTLWLSVGGDQFGRHFAGDYYRLLRVAWWVARVSFGGP